MSDEDTEETAAPRDRGRSVWLHPGGISAIAGVAAVLVSVIGLLIAFRPETSPPRESPSSEPTEAGPAMFVYGSSMPGQSRHDEIEQYVIEIDKDSVDGMLYDSGLGYPIAKFGPGGQIPGYVLWLDPATAEDVFREQTKLESGLFHPVTVRTKNGINARAYEWIEGTDGFPRIEKWDGSTAGYGQYISAAELTKGDCFQLTTYLDEVMTQWCEAPHAFQAYFAEMDADAHDEQLSAERCRTEFEPFVGSSVDDSALEIEVLRPDTAQELLVCAVHRSDQLLIGTAADSRL